VYEIGLFGLAFLARFFHLRLFPVTHDEAAWTFGSLNNFDKFMGIPVACFHGYIQPFFSYLVFFTNKVFISPEFILRVPAVIIGSATVTMVYILGKEMYGRKTGLFSSFLLCLLPWHVIQSRVGVSVILTPFFGCLIFLSLFKAINKKNNLWFFLSWFFLGVGAFYTYQNSLLFIPIFLATLLFLRKELHWLKFNIFILSIIVFLIIVYPLIHLQITGQIPEYFGKVYGMYYNYDNFKVSLSDLLFKSFVNFRGNIFESFKGLFFTEYSFQFGKALHYPALINFLSLLIIVLSIALSLYYRKAADKIILIWLVLGYIGSISGVRLHDVRYIIIVLPVFLILMGRFIAEIFNRMPKKVSFRRVTLFFLGVSLFLTLAFSEISQLTKYYLSAPADLEECRMNSYGCKETALYLSKIPGIEAHRIVSDAWMEPLFVYLNYYLPNKKIISGFNRELNMTRQELREEIYYLVWAPESHPQDYREGMYGWLWKNVQMQYPKLSPVHTVYYPNGYPAIYIFKVKLTLHASLNKEIPIQASVLNRF